MIDPTNRVVALCAEGMAMEGSPADAHEQIGERGPAASAVQRAALHLDDLPAGGYRTLVARGIRRLAERVGVALDIGQGD